VRKLRYVAVGVLAGLAATSLVGLGYAASTGGPASAAQYEYKKVTICHHTQGKGGTHHVTITVSRNALPAHMRHGDTMGPCNSAQSRAAHSKKTHVKKFHKTSKQTSTKPNKNKPNKPNKPAKPDKPDKPGKGGRP
jgi:hypothetical protein